MQRMSTALVRARTYVLDLAPGQYDNVTVTPQITNLIRVGQLELIENYSDPTPVYTGAPTPYAPAPVGVAATDTATVLAAIASGAQLRAGTYVVNTNAIALGSGAVLRGLGYGATTLKAAAGQTGRVITTANWLANIADPHAVPWADACRGVTIEGIRIDGSGTAALGLGTFGYGHRLDGIVIDNCDKPWVCDGPGGPTMFFTETDTPAPGPSNFVSNVIAHHNKQGVEWLRPSDSYIDGCQSYLNGTTGAPAAYGWRFGPEANGYQMSNAHVWGRDHLIGIQCEIDGYLVNTEAEGARNVNLLVLGNQVRVKGGNYYAAAEQYSKNTRNIQVGDGTHPVEGCDIDTFANGANYDGTGSGCELFMANDAGYNRISLAGYQPYGIFTQGIQHPTTEIEYKSGSGIPGGLLRYSDRKARESRFVGRVNLAPGGGSFDTNTVGYVENSGDAAALTRTTAWRHRGTHAARVAKTNASGGNIYAGIQTFDIPIAAGQTLVSEAVVRRVVGSANPDMWVIVFLTAGGANLAQIEVELGWDLTEKLAVVSAVAPATTAKANVFLYRTLAPGAGMEIMLDDWWIYRLL